MLKGPIRRRSRVFDFANISGELVYANDMVNLTYLPSKSCYAGKLSESFSDKLRYIENRIHEQHESVIEHSNVVMVLRLGGEKYKLFLSMVNGFKYLNVESSEIKNSTYLLIGGSIRGYKHLIRETLDQNNPILKHIKDCLYESCYREFFLDLIEAGFMRDSFVNPGVSMTYYGENELTESEELELEKKINSQNMCNTVPTSDERVEMLNVDPIQIIYNDVKKYGFTMDQCLSMATVSILFKNMSRIITQQLTRHRNGITQESQRYVNYSQSCFNSPELFKPEKYDSEKLYGLVLKPYEGHDELYINAAHLQDIGDMLCSIYGQLVEQGLEKEDARGFLPQNVQCTKLYMTFTYRTLMAFIDLRTDSHAQAEIREYANIIKDAFYKYLEAGTEDFMEMMGYYKTPRCMKMESPEYNSESVEEEITLLDEVVPDEIVEDEDGGNIPYSEFDEDANAAMYKDEYESAKTGKYNATRADVEPTDKGEV